MDYWHGYNTNFEFGSSFGLWIWILLGQGLASVRVATLQEKVTQIKDLTRSHCLYNRMNN